jgi:hypothetical protein
MLFLLKSFLFEIFDDTLSVHFPNVGDSPFVVSTKLEGIPNNTPHIEIFHKTIWHRWDVIGIVTKTRKIITILDKPIPTRLQEVSSDFDEAGNLPIAHFDTHDRSLPKGIMFSGKCILAGKL